MVTVAEKIESTPTAASPRMRVLAPLDGEEFAQIRREMALRYCKWDPQVGDTSTLAPFPMVILRQCWAELSGLAEQLADEVCAAEMELLHRPELHRRLGIPWRIRRCLRRSRAQTDSPRLMRFDFHWTSEGWRISEVNSDVPGGFTESSSFPMLMARHFDDCEMVGDVAGKWTRALIERAEGRPIGLLSAAGFMEDHQITNYLGGRIRGHVGGHASGYRSMAPEERALVITGKQLRWCGGRGMVGDVELGLVLRFFQAEWLPSLGRKSGWENFFDSKTPISNPVCSILTESKRFPLVWDNLRTPLPTWRRLLPETRDPREINWRSGENWLLKSALCNNGDSVSIPGSPQWPKALRSANWFPGYWLAQKRFEILPLATPAGAMYPCLGVYVLNGRSIGIYGRISGKAVIDHTAIDVAVLLEKE